MEHQGKSRSKNRKVLKVFDIFAFIAANNVKKQAGK